MKKQNGITLIALVITIIVLLILAGVSIAMLAGEGGILGKATSATESTLVGEVDEAIKLALSEILANKLDPTYTKTQNVVNAANLTELIPANNANVGVGDTYKIPITIEETMDTTETTKVKTVTIKSTIKKVERTWIIDAPSGKITTSPTTSTGSGD